MSADSLSDVGLCSGGVITGNVEVGNLIRCAKSLGVEASWLSLCRHALSCSLSPERGVGASSLSPLCSGGSTLLSLLAVLGHLSAE